MVWRYNAGCRLRLKGGDRHGRDQRPHVRLEEVCTHPSHIPDVIAHVVGDHLAASSGLWGLSVAGGFMAFWVSIGCCGNVVLFRTRALSTGRFEPHGWMPGAICPRTADRGIVRVVLVDAALDLADEVRADLLRVRDAGPTSRVLSTGGNVTLSSKKSYKPSQNGMPPSSPAAPDLWSLPTSHAGTSAALV